MPPTNLKTYLVIQQATQSVNYLLASAGLAKFSHVDVHPITVPAYTIPTITPTINGLLPLVVLHGSTTTRYLQNETFHPVGSDVDFHVFFYNPNTYTLLSCEQLSPVFEKLKVHGKQHNITVLDYVTSLGFLQLKTSIQIDGQQVLIDISLPAADKAKLVPVSNESAILVDANGVLFNAVIARKFFDANKPGFIQSYAIASLSPLALTTALSPEARATLTNTLERKLIPLNEEDTKADHKRLGHLIKKIIIAEKRGIEITLQCEAIIAISQSEASITFLKACLFCLQNGYLDTQHAASIRHGFNQEIPALNNRSFHQRFVYSVLKLLGVKGDLTIKFPFSRSRFYKFANSQQLLKVYLDKVVEAIHTSINLSKNKNLHVLAEIYGAFSLTMPLLTSTYAHVVSSTPLPPPTHLATSSKTQTTRPCSQPVPSAAHNETETNKSSSPSDDIPGTPASITNRHDPTPQVSQVSTDGALQNSRTSCKPKAQSNKLSQKRDHSNKPDGKNQQRESHEVSTQSKHSTAQASVSKAPEVTRRKKRQNKNSGVKQTTKGVKPNDNRIFAVVDQKNEAIIQAKKTLIQQAITTLILILQSPINLVLSLPSYLKVLNKHPQGKKPKSQATKHKRLRDNKNKKLTQNPTKLSDTAPSSATQIYTIFKLALNQPDMRYSPLLIRAYRNFVVAFNLLYYFSNNKDKSSVGEMVSAILLYGTLATLFGSAPPNLIKVAYHADNVGNTPDYEKQLTELLHKKNITQGESKTFWVTLYSLICATLLCSLLFEKFTGCFSDFLISHDLLSNDQKDIFYDSASIVFIFLMGCAVAEKVTEYPKESSPNPASDENATPPTSTPQLKK